MSTRKYLVGSIVWGLAGALPLLAGCATDMEDTQVEVAGDDGLDAEIEQMLGAAVSGCASNSSPGTTDGFGFSSGTLYLLLGSNGSAVISQAAGKVSVNGAVCTSMGSSTVSKIQVSENSGSTGVQTVVLDQLPAAFSSTLLGSSGGITLNLGSGTDVVSLRGTTGADSYKVFEGTNSTAYIELNGNTNADVKIVKTAGTVTLKASLGVGNDTFIADSSATSPTTFAGTAFSGRAGAGAAVIGSLTVYGGNGNDTLTGATAATVLYGDLGSDALTGGAGADQLYGESTTLATNGNGNDTISGGAGADTVWGGNGNDVITGGADADSLLGGAGNDTFVATVAAATDGNDNLDGGAGTDSLDYSVRTAAVTVNLTAGTAGLSGEADTLTGFESVTTGTGDDTITGSASADTLNGGNGADSIIGAAGADTISGGDGDDVFVMGADTAADGLGDVLNGNGGTDTVDYSGRSAALSLSNDGTATDGASGETDNITTTIEVIKGGSAADTITGGANNDTLYGNGDADVITAGAGDDVVYGGADGDNISGGNGNDTIDAEGGADTVYGGEGDDSIIPGFTSGDDDGAVDWMNGGNGNDTLDYSDRTSAVTVYLCSSTSATTFANATAQDAVEDSVDCDGTTGVSGRGDTDTAVNFEIYDGSSGGDTVYGSSGDDTIYTNGGADSVFGGSGADHIDDGGGSGAIDGGSGDDICVGTSTTTNCEL